MIYSHEDYARQPSLAVAPIGGLLATSRLNLFLGAGVSASFGLPDWALLIARLEGKEGDVKYVDSLRGKSDAELAARVNPFDDGTDDYLERLHEALYRKVAPDLADQLPASPLLLAIAALLTGSCRGRVQRIFTYNYDDLLEQYIGMLGYASCVRTGPMDYSTWADVEINHVHGFLPQGWTRGDKIVEPILSERSYRNRRVEIDKGWSAAVTYSFYDKSALLMTLSGNDSSMLDVLKRTVDSVQRVEDYHGYWLLTPDAYERNSASILNVGLCPVPLERADFPRFIFSVCQRAIAVNRGEETKN